MLAKSSRLYSILHLKCPRCHEGSLFTYKTYSRRFAVMPEKCPVCHLQYQPEPAFYTGAMYVSYALQVALFAIIYMVLRLFSNPDIKIYLVAMITAPLLLVPVTLRLSRAIYIHLFYTYQPDWNKNPDEGNG